MSFFDEELEDDLDESARGPFDVSRIRETLLLSVLSLASGDGGLRSRLGGAFQHLGTLRVEEFPCDLRFDFSRIASAKPQDDEATKKIISDLVLLADAVSRRVDRPFYSTSRRGW